MKDADIDDNMLALKSMEALEKVAQGKSTKLVLPSDAVNFLGTFKGIKEVMKDDDDIKININNKMVKVHPNNKYYCLQRLPIFLIISIICI